MTILTGEVLKQGGTYTVQFPMVLTSDHVSPATGKSPVVKLGKAGASGVTATNSPATEVDSSNLPGVYKIGLVPGDLNTLGDLALVATAASCDQTTVVYQVSTNVINDFRLDANENVIISSNVKQNQALNGFPFVMRSSVSNLPQPGLTVTAQRSLGGAGFAPCANAVTEVALGSYAINFAASDVNSPAIMFLFTAPGANALYIPILTQP